MALDKYGLALHELLDDPATSYCLRKRLTEDGQRDALDAVKDAETLLRLARLRLNLVMP